MTEATSIAKGDPRALLSEWANNSPEWVRYIVRRVLNNRGQLGSEEHARAYDLLRQENGLDPRKIPTENQLDIPENQDEATEKLTLTALSNVVGVNALVNDAVIEPHAALTILYGENGTGKTGYSRIFKALAGSRTADDVILENIETEPSGQQSAQIEYMLGNEKKSYNWTGEKGVKPFTRISIFDNPSVSYHVDSDLEYAFVPATLALFEHIIAGIKSVKDRIEKTVNNLRPEPSELLARFATSSTIYPMIQQLGASTNLENLKSRARFDEDVKASIEDLRRTVAKLEANTLGADIQLQERFQRVLTQAVTAATAIASFDADIYNCECKNLHVLERDLEVMRTDLFKTDDLPAEVDETFFKFIEAGKAYQEHLISVGAHDAKRCLYCRQSLNEEARGLIGRYSKYLDDKIATEIQASRKRLRDLAEPVTSTNISEVSIFATEYAEKKDKPQFHGPLDQIRTTLAAVSSLFDVAATVDRTLLEQIDTDAQELSAELETVTQTLNQLKTQRAARQESLAEKKKELIELEAADELAKSWRLIESHVSAAKQIDKLVSLQKDIPTLLRKVTDLSKTASEQMVNKNFDRLFAEECVALRAPEVSVKFFGQQGRAQRRKTLNRNHKPSKVFSEGEQKVLALADFLAEARLAGFHSPVIFDDPVSSLDHRRIKEVAERIALLAETAQVIVFTHDIYFASTLLQLMNQTEHCSYFQITDEGGKGKVFRATGPRWDTLKEINKRVNKVIEEAEAREGDERAEKIRIGFGAIRSWCEVFAELVLLNGVTRRYEPNVRMGNLAKIKFEALPGAIEKIIPIFERASRYFEGHSQPLATLGVAPTLKELKDDWAQLTKIRSEYNKALR